MRARDVKNYLLLFGAVPAKKKEDGEPILVEELGLVIMPSAQWCKKQIIKFYRDKLVNGDEFYTSFYKSWDRVSRMSHIEHWLHQILHYISTYGTNFTGPTYIPLDEIDADERTTPTLRVIVVQGISRDDAQRRCRDLLSSGAALSEEMMDAIIEIIDVSQLSLSSVKNREMIIRLIDTFDITPDDPVEFLRYVVYKLTGSSLLIKSSDACNSILLSNSKFDVGEAFTNYGLDKLASIFYRFKPLFLAMKKRCPSVINRIRRLAPQYHKPFVDHPLNLVTERKLQDSDDKTLFHSNIFHLIRAFNACQMYMQIDADYKYVIHKIRNGKVWVREVGVPTNEDVRLLMHNRNTILDILAERLDFRGVKYYFDPHYTIAVPTSTKLFIDNLPFGSSVGVSDEVNHLVAGVYWRNAWGAYDLDLSAYVVSFDTKVGWDGVVRAGGDACVWSGDITNAPIGASEYVRFRTDNKTVLEAGLFVNIYSGEIGTKCKLLFGSAAPDCKTFRPNNVDFSFSYELQRRQTLIGVVYGKSIIPCNITLTNARSMRNKELAKAITRAVILYQTTCLSMPELLFACGAIPVERQEEADIVFLPEQLAKDTLIGAITNGSLTTRNRVRDKAGVE